MYRIYKEDGTVETGFTTREEAEKSASVFDEIVECVPVTSLTDLLYT